MSRRLYPERVLIVEDTPFMAEVLRDIFTDEGFEVSWARDGAEALEIYPLLLPDFVTLDILMPGMDGLEVLEKLLILDPACKVIMVSAVGMESNVVRAISSGAKNFVVKPFDRDRILRCVNAVLREY